jgi:hypothetical protein
MMIVALLLAQVAPVPAPPKPLATTIAAIRANPKKFDGQVVHLTGYVNRCSALDCAISERRATAAGGLGQTLSIATDPKFDATVAPLAPTFVEFDARFDASCVINVCIDRAPVLTVVTLRGVVSPEPPAIEK